MIYFDSAFYCSSCECFADHDENRKIILFICDGNGELECTISLKIFLYVVIGIRYVFGITRLDEYRIDVVVEHSERTFPSDK
jgi:hypothetical protein